MATPEQRIPRFPFDDLSRALSLKNRRDALAILEKRGGLTWLEASEYAPLTLGWAPDLLALILDMAPEGEELFCLHVFRCPDDLDIYVCASLLTAAAALDDLQAAELLLARGYETGEDALYRNLYLSPHFHELPRIRSHAMFVKPNSLHIYSCAHNSVASLYRASPLAAAVFCGAERCALRLLRETGNRLDRSVRRALARCGLPGDTGHPAAVRAVAAALGADPAELVDPADIDSWNSPLFLECLKRHRTQVPPGVVRYLIEWANCTDEARAGLRIVDPLLLSHGLLALMRDGGYREDQKMFSYIFSQPDLDLVLDRNAVSPAVDTDGLLVYLDHARVVGEVSNGTLSGLAANLLGSLLERARSGTRTGLDVFFSPRVIAALKEEDTSLIWEYVGRADYNFSSYAAHMMLTLMTRLDRWTAVSRCDALSWALSMKNRRAARGILEKRGGLTWLEATEYAPLTLGWAPDLLTLILDMAPEREELFCLHNFHRSGGRTVYVCAGLLTAAAALDDLRAVELLLARGYETGEDALYRNLYLSPHYHELLRLRSTAMASELHTLHIFLRNDCSPSASLHRTSPLAAAVFCGAERCALRLLRETGSGLDRSVRRALARRELPGDPGHPAAARAVAATLGTGLAELVDPADIDDRSSPLFLECLKRHRAQVPPGVIMDLLAWGDREDWAREGLRLIDPLHLSRCLLEGLRRNSRRRETGTFDYIFRQPGLDLVLDRNAVSARINTDELLTYADHARVVGKAPSGALSGLAANLLDYVVKQHVFGNGIGSKAFFSTKAFATLREEAPDLIREYLSIVWGGICPAHVTRLIMTLSGFQEEENYEL